MVGGVVGAEQPLVGGDGEYEQATGFDHALQGVECGAIVGDVLEHVEHANDVVRGYWGQVARQMAWQNGAYTLCGCVLPRVVVHFHGGDWTKLLKHGQVAAGAAPYFQDAGSRGQGECLQEGLENFAPGDEPPVTLLELRHLPVGFRRHDRDR